MTLSGRLWLSATLALAWALAAGPVAQAATLSLSVVTDPSLGTIDALVDVDSNPGQRWLSAPIPIGPIMLDQGDTVSVSVSFSGGQAIAVQGGPFLSAQQNLGYSFSPTGQGGAVQGTATLVSFSGVLGDLDAALPIVGSFSTTNQIAGSILRELTDTSFQFDGFQMDTIYTALAEGPVNLSSVRVLVASTGVTVVPEPATGTLVALGLAGLAASRPTRERARRH